MEKSQGIQYGKSLELFPYIFKTWAKEKNENKKKQNQIKGKTQINGLYIARQVGPSRGKPAKTKI
jgi:hypothetical protein